MSPLNRLRITDANDAELVRKCILVEKFVLENTVDFAEAGAVLATVLGSVIVASARHPTLLKVMRDLSTRARDGALLELARHKWGRAAEIEH